MRKGFSMIRRKSVALKMQDSRTKYARSGGVNIAYKVFGEGEHNLILIPGWISNLEEITKIPQLSAWINYLSTFSTVLTFDKRGTGLSDRVNENELPNMAQRTEDLLAVMEANNIESAAFLGLSEGGPMAIHLAANYPQKVSRLILVGSFAKWTKSDNYPYGMTKEEHAKVIDYMFDHWGEPIGLHLMAPSVKDNPEAQEQWATYLRHSASPSAAKAFYQMNLEIDVRSSLKNVKQPTLIIHREGDRLLECGHSKYLHENIVGSTLLLTNGDDHLPWFGINQEELTALQTFLLGGKAVTNDQLSKLSSKDIFSMYAIKGHIENNFSDDITIGSLAKKFGMNDFKIKNGFKALFGMPIINYLTDARLEHSCQLLADASQTISQIAEKVGYGHPNNYATAFKRKYGLTPNEYRAKLKEGKNLN